MGNQGSFIHVGSEAWSVWSDSTDELLSLKLPKFILVLIGRCQNKQCIKVAQRPSTSISSYIYVTYINI